MPNKSLIEIAYEFVSSQKDPVLFKTIWEAVKEKAELTEEEAAAKLSRFYTNLILDGRFVTLQDNFWDLRSRQTFDKVHIDMKDVYSDVEEMDKDSEEEDEEEKIYNESLDNDQLKDSDDFDSDEEQSENEDEL